MALVSESDGLIASPICNTTLSARDMTTLTVKCTRTAWPHYIKVFSDAGLVARMSGGLSLAISLKREQCGRRSRYTHFAATGAETRPVAELLFDPDPWAS